jgi:hypothetical protein
MKKKFYPRPGKPGRIAASTVPVGVQAFKPFVSIPLKRVVSFFQEKIFYSHIPIPESVLYEYFTHLHISVVAGSSA